MEGFAVFKLSDTIGEDGEVKERSESDENVCERF